MEIKRKIYNKILEWKRSSNGSKALLIEGARRMNYTTTSLGRFKNMFGKKIAMQYIIHPKNLSADGEIMKIPPYMFCVAFR